MQRVSRVAGWPQTPAWAGFCCPGPRPGRQHLAVVMLAILTVYVLAVSIIAGLGNLPGGLVVGLLLGILEAVAQGYISGSWSNVIAFVVMLVVILMKPSGLFGSKL